MVVIGQVVFDYLSPKSGIIFETSYSYTTQWPASYTKGQKSELLVDKIHLYQWLWKYLIQILNDRFFINNMNFFNVFP